MTGSIQINYNYSSPGPRDTDDIDKITGSKVKDSQRRPYISCELDSSWTTERTWNETLSGSAND